MRRLQKIGDQVIVRALSQALFGAPIDVSDWMIELGGGCDPGVWEIGRPHPPLCLAVEGASYRDTESV
jgi:hypothetical protein